MTLLLCDDATEIRNKRRLDQTNVTTDVKNGGMHRVEPRKRVSIFHGHFPIITFTRSNICTRKLTSHVLTLRGDVGPQPI